MINSNNREASSSSSAPTKTESNGNDDKNGNGNSKDEDAETVPLRQKKISERPGKCREMPGEKAKKGPEKTHQSIGYFFLS